MLGLGVRVPSLGSEGTRFWEGSRWLIDVVPLCGT